MAEGEPASKLDPDTLVGLFEAFLMGAEPSYTPVQVAERTGIPLETARSRWRSLGFTAVEDDEVAFTDADVRALELTEKVAALGLVDPDTESSMVRTLGRSFARLAEWQMTLVARSLDLEKTSLEELGTYMDELVPLMEEVMDYVWRRHTVNAAARLLLAPSGGEAGQPLGVGFADIVGYTRQSRSLKEPQLVELVEKFEATALAIITEHRGRIIKTIGDEILFVADTPEDAAEIALLLTEMHVQDDDFPELRVGAAYGPVLARLGDVYGPVVNIASRLTSLARPGKVLIDKGLAEQLKDSDDTDGYRIRKMRRTSVKGYRRLEPFSLRRPVGSNPEFDPEKLPGPASKFVAQRAEDLLRAIDEGEPSGEGPVEREDVEERPGR